jgi:large subunit ribosomal protein L6
MNKAKKKQIVKIPSNIEVFYSKEKKIIIFRGPMGKKSLNIDPSISIYRIKQQIEVINDISKKLSNSEKKKIKSVQRTTVSLIKQLLIEAVALVYRKLKLVGVGYRVFPAENFEGHLLLLKLGYSHPIYFKIPSNLSIFCLKLTKLFLYGSSHQQVTSTASKIRLNKTPEPYKGKGILYDNEKIVLKEGKKV